MAIKILLVDDHKIMREGLRALLEKQTDMEVVDEARDGRIAIQLARKYKPNVIVMDVNMPGVDGIDATQRISKELKDTKIIALSMFPKKTFAVEMLRAGASGYLLKEDTFAELVKAIKAVVAGKVYLCSKVANIVLDDYVHAHLRIGDSERIPLTGREREILKLFADGKASKEIAVILDKSVKTIDAHRRQIMNKLNIDNFAGLVKYAVREGLTSLDR